jgi:N-acetylneuraminic acid mutarotase
MPQDDESGPMMPLPNTLSRRTILVSAATTALAASLQPVQAAARLEPRSSAVHDAESDVPIRRYMAAAAALGDGRILITGGYGRPWKAGETLLPLNSAIILDPSSGRWVAAASMSAPRARHAAVALRNGQIAVLGGIGFGPTDSVEIYDPRTDTWTVGTPLAQPRYDHTAVVDGPNIHLIGGSAHTMLASVEHYQPEKGSTGSGAIY